MLEARSPLGVAARYERAGVVLFESSGYELTQVAGEEKVLKTAFGKLPSKTGTILEREGRTFLRIGPKQFWIVGEAVAPADELYVTPLSSARTRIALEGSRSRDVLSSCALIDFSPKQFKPGQFVMTGIHHTPVTIHCTGENSFHIYALRTFALNVWEWLCDVAEGLDHA